MTLRAILHAHIPTLTETSTVRDAVDKMDIYQFPALVVVDEAMAPIAVVTEGDIIREVINRGNLGEMRDEPVLPIATKEPIIAEAQTEIGDALHDMISRGITILPVVDDGRLAGVVLRVDLMQAILTDTVALG